MVKISSYEADIIRKISNGRTDPKSDKACKMFLSLKQIAARILKAVAKEYKDMPIDEIISLMSTPSVNEDTLDPNAEPPVIHTDNSEDSSIDEGTRFYDIRFTARVPNNDKNVQLIINIEAQNEFDTEYSLIKRGIYYCSRLISGQYGTIFKHMDYDKIQKVYSIWICTDPAKEFADSIRTYSLKKELLYGSDLVGEPAAKEAEKYDLITLVLVCLKEYDEKDRSANKLIDLLTTMLAPQVSSDDKIKTLDKDYGIPVTNEISERVNSMCNISAGFFRDGVSEGFFKGKDEGKAEGRAEKEVEIIRTMLGDNRTVQEIAAILHFPVEEVEKVKKTVLSQ